MSIWQYIIYSISSELRFNAGQISFFHTFSQFNFCSLNVKFTVILVKKIEKEIKEFRYISVLCQEMKSITHFPFTRFEHPCHWLIGVSKLTHVCFGWTSPSPNRDDYTDHDPQKGFGGFWGWWWCIFHSNWQIKQRRMIKPNTQLQDFFFCGTWRWWEITDLNVR